MLGLDRGNQQSLRKLILDTWLDAGAGPVTGRMLRKIQSALKQTGVQTPFSPASIARLLADEGAELRHPDVIEADAAWREAYLKPAIDEETGNPLSLASAAALINKLESHRKKLPTDTDRLQELREEALNEKAKAQLLAADRSYDEETRNTQTEIVEWFRVWLQTPEIFNDWLDLRRRAREFQDKFGEFNP